MEFENCCEEQRMNDEDVGTEEELIDLVKACPILYDVRLKVYKDRNMKDSAWHSISEAMKLSVLECKNKWKNIRDAYVKFLHAVREESVSGKKVKKRYKYADKMKFLDRCIQHRNPPGTVNTTRSLRDSVPQNNSASMVVNYLDDSTTVPEDETSTPAKDSNLASPSRSNQEMKREDSGEERYGKVCKLDPEKHNDIGQHATIIDEHDDSKLFCLSLISTLKRLDSRKRQLAKIRIQNVLYEVEFNEPSDT